MLGDAAPSDPFGLVGRLLERKYRVDRVHAVGGYGVVYAGMHLGLDEPIAIKVLKPAEGVDEDGWADLMLAFADEARTLARLRHPSVVSVLDSGTTFVGERTVPWMVLEWLDGETLGAELERRNRTGKGGRSPGEALDLLRPVLEAMAVAHDAGVVHRDLKPSNVMLVPRAGGVSPRVLDFGIAKIMAPEEGGAGTGDTATASHTIAFTAASAAPEQLSGGRTGPWTDVYALGLLLTELLTDQPPVPAADPTERYRAVFDPVRPTPARVGVDVGAWEPVLRRALALRPTDRQPDARALLAELQASLPAARQEGPPNERPTADAGTAPGAPTAARSGRTAVFVLGALGVAIAGAIAFSPPSASGGPAGAAASPSGTVASGASTVAADAGAACADARACVVRLGGRGAVCSAGRCVELASEDCVVRGDDAVGRDDAVWIGALFPRTGPLAPEYGDYNHNALELARRQVAEIMKGTARPVGLLACDDAADARRAATHLVDVGAPAVVGFRTSLEAIELAKTVFLPAETLMMAAVNPSPLVTRVPHPPGSPRLIYRTTASAADATAAAGAFLSGALEPRLREDGVVPAGKAIRVATLRPKDAAGDVVGDALLARLRFNGKSAMDNGRDFHEVTFDDDGTGASPSHAVAVDALVAFAPHVVVYTGAQAVTRGILAPLERRLPARKRPRYLSLGEMHQGIYDLVGKDGDLRRRFFGMTLLVDSPENARLILRYNDAFANKITRTATPNSTYDAFYLLAYASFAVPAGGPVTGRALAEAIPRLVPPGRPIAVGTADLFDAFEELRAGRSIDVTGATGPLDFDVATGEASFDQVILCLGADKDGNAAEGVASGLVVSAKTRTLGGTLRCRLRDGPLFVWFSMPRDGRSFLDSGARTQAKMASATMRRP